MKFYLTCLAGLLSYCLPAQSIFPDLTGQELVDSLAANFRPATVYSYNAARDTLYAKIDSRNDSLYCVYTGFGVLLDITQDPTQDAFAKGINAEHTWPRSRGAENGNPLADMHHLFPTRQDVNADRGSLPFGEIPDAQTASWYLGSQQTSSLPPAAIRDFYSEILPSVRFEPREDHKGNVARAMFYFYTVYRNESDAIDPNYFPPQIPELCDWHLADPVDSRELLRSEAIAQRQDGKVNPFVADCNLAMRAYCPDLPLQNCLSSTAAPVLPAPFQLHGVGYTGTAPYLMFTISQPVSLRVEWYDALGRALITEEREWVGAGTFQLNINAAAWRTNRSGPLLGRIMLRDAAGQWFTERVMVP